MIVLELKLEPGFRKANIGNIPTINNDTIIDFVTRLATCEKNAALAEATKNKENSKFSIDFVQVKRTQDVTEVRGVVFELSTLENDETHCVVTVKVDEASAEILETDCDQCKNEVCPHIHNFIFWLHQKANDTQTPAITDFWGAEVSERVDERANSLRIRDMFLNDDLRVECDMEAEAVNEVDGDNFLDAVLDEMEATGLRDTLFSRYCRPACEEFESIFIHHTMLDASTNGVKDMRSFVQHMEDQAKQGIFDQLTQVTRTNYKSPLWLEAQYMRLRCALIHRIASRKDMHDDEDILNSLMCKEREKNVEERQQLKHHKRFILKQTEKLENKSYVECGILLSESYPYICASPDGITDDHIVEIKAPKTEQEFEKYLEGRETIAPKYMAQIQIQMYMANVTKALYCVLSPTFDTNGALHYVWVQADMEFVASLLGAAEDFWKDVVFPRLAQIYSIED